MTWTPPPPLRWESPAGRYYLVRFDYDLFGGLVLSRYWGGSKRPGGSAKHAPVSSQADALAKLEKIAKSRERHGYLLVAGVLPVRG